MTSTEAASVFMIGTHPEYVTKIADITNAREARLSIAANRLRHSMIHIDSELNAAIEQASDTFLVTLRAPIPIYTTVLKRTIFVFMGRIVDGTLVGSY